MTTPGIEQTILQRPQSRVATIDDDGTIKSPSGQSVSTSGQPGGTGLTPEQDAKLSGLPDAAALAVSLAGKVGTDRLGAPSGVAELDSTGKLKASQLPASALVDVSATGAALSAGVLSFQQDEGGPTITVDLNSFATDAEVTAGLAGKASITVAQQEQKAAGATTALLNAAKTGLVDPVSGATISFGGPGGSVDAPAVQAALAADPAGARAAMGVYSTTQVDQAIADAGVGGGTTIVGLSPLWTPVSYSTTIPLDGRKCMPATAVTGPVSFSPSAEKLAGAFCTLRLVANDADTPQFVGMVQSPDSDGWAPIANTIHTVKFEYDGTSTLYDITQLVSNPVAVPIQGVPVILSAAPSTITVPYSAALLTSSVPPPSAYPVATTGAALSIIAVAVSGAAVNLTSSRPLTAGEVVTLYYATPATSQIKSVGGMPAASFTGLSVANGLALGDYLTFAIFPSFTQSLKNDAGYDTYVSLSSATVGGFTPKSATPSRMLVASPAADQYFEITLDADLADAANEVIALHNNLTSQVNTTATYSCFGHATTGFWKQQTGGMTLVSGTTPYAGSDRARYVRTPANTLRFEVSKDDGATWIVIASKTAITDGSLYPRIGTGGPSQTIRRPKCNGPVAV